MTTAHRSSPNGGVNIFISDTRIRSLQGVAYWFDGALDDHAEHRGFKQMDNESDAAYRARVTDSFTASGARAEAEEGVAGYAAELAVYLVDDIEKALQAESNS